VKTNPRIYLSCVLAIASIHTAMAFQPEEATIEGMQNAIKSGEITCKGVVEAYLARAQAYNGVCTALVTADGASVKPLKGYVRAGKPLVFTTKTVKAGTLFPELDQYKGLPLEYGRMEKTVSDPSVWQQQGMRVGIPNAGQLNALETLNIRGERSITCKGKFDARPSTGPLPAGAPPECEKFRQQPDALERAAELDAQYGPSCARRARSSMGSPLHTSSTAGRAIRADRTRRRRTGWTAAR
jgi:amidase